MSITENSANVLTLDGIHKRFPGVNALKGVTFTLARGEVRGLVGENGAGKSTLMNVLGGVVQPNEGRIYIDENSVVINSPADSQELGISFIHQELSLFVNLDIATNIFMNDLPRKGGLIDQKRLLSETKEILNRVGLSHLPPGRLVKHLPMGERQLVEIAQSLTRQPRILILDEPTSSLTKKEIDVFFSILRSLKAEGVSIIFISHRLDEVFDVCDSVTIMRDGEIVGTRHTSEIERGEVVRLMIGREVGEMYTHNPVKAGKTLLEVKNLTRGNKYSDISFSVREGEIVGLYGLMGSGRTEIVRSIFGLDPLDDGAILVEGDTVSIRSPKDAISHGLALITENRREEGLVTIHSVKSNLVLSNLSAFRSALAFMDGTKESCVSEENIRDFNIRTSTAAKPVRFLSGGNQQKVVIAKWMNTFPKVLILDEPTRGIDVGAKSEVFRIIDEMLRRRVGVFVISSELPEIMGICDRVYVIRNGSLVAHFDGNSMEDHDILAYAMGAK
jgi:ABC-type sugar transport system ATPase subunit